MSNFKYDVSIASLSLYDSSKEKIVYDTSDFPTYLLDSTLKDSFLKQYHQLIFPSYLQYLVDLKPTDIDIMYEVSQERRTHIENIRNGPYFNLLKIKTNAELQNFINRLKAERIQYYHNVDTKTKDDILHVFNQFAVYNGSLYMPENVVLHYTEKQKGVYYPLVDYSEDEKKYTIYVGYLMKKVKSLNLT